MEDHCRDLRAFEVRPGNLESAEIDHLDGMCCKTGRHRQNHEHMLLHGKMQVGLYFTYEVR